MKVLLWWKCLWNRGISCRTWIVTNSRGFTWSKSLTIWLMERTVCEVRSSRIRVTSISFLRPSTSRLRLYRIRCAYRRLNNFRTRCRWLWWMWGHHLSAWSASLSNSCVWWWWMRTSMRWRWRSNTNPSWGITSNLITRCWTTLRIMVGGYITWTNWLEWNITTSNRL